MDSFVVFFLGLIAGTAVTIAAEIFRGWYGRPRLDILDDSPEEAAAFSCHAIRVTNFGRTTANRCVGMLTFIDLHHEDVLGEESIATLEKLGVDPDKFDVHGDETFLMKGGNFRPITNELTAWSRVGNPVTIDIFPQTYAMLDVCRFMRGSTPQLHLPSERGWKSVRAALKSKPYRIQVTVVGENARAATRTFRIDPNPNGIAITQDEGSS
jgi:hypothetical protein